MLHSYFQKGSSFGHGKKNSHLIVTSTFICGISACVATRGAPHSLKKSLVYIHKCVFFTLRHFFLFWPRVFPRALGSVAHREPARTPYASLSPGRGPWHVLWGLKVARPLGEAFRARRAIQAHANPHVHNNRYILNKFKKRPTSFMIPGILNVINAVRHYTLGDGKVLPDTHKS